MTRPCGCPGLPRSRHLSASERAALGLGPCHERGRKSGPSGPSLPTSKRGPTSSGNKQIRLPEVLRVAIVSAEARGVTADEMAKALDAMRA